MKFVLLIFLFLPLFGTSQVCSYDKSLKDATELCDFYRGSAFASDRNADIALDKILSVIGASKRFVLMPCDDIDNCVATTYKGVRYILYDRGFMREIAANTNAWSKLSILAHEAGHHINGHTFDLVVYATGAANPPSLSESRKQELEADEFSGFVMQKLGASLSQSQEAIAYYTSYFDDTFSTHPSKEKRLKAIENGYNKAKSQQEPNKYKPNPSNLAAADYFYRAYDFHMREEYQLAIDDYTRVIRIDPNYADAIAYYNRGLAYCELGKDQLAIGDFTRLIDLNYGEASTYSILIKMHRIDSNDTERLAVIQKGRQAYPDDNNIIIEELKYYNDKQDRSKSIEILKIAIKKDHDNVVLYYWLGTMHDQAGDFEQGKKVFARALALAEPEYRQQKEAYKLARGTETERSSKAALDKIHENYFNILYNFAALYYNRGVAKLKSIEDIEDNRVYTVERDKAESIMVKALPLLEKALELNPTDRSTITSLKDLYARTEDEVNWERMYDLLEMLEK